MKTSDRFKQIVDSVEMTYSGTRRCDWYHPANHYKVVLKRNGAQWTVKYSMGLALKGGPNKLDVLASLVIDAQSYVNARNLDDFLYGYGYDRYDEVQLKRGMAAYSACQKAYERMNGKFFSRAEYRILEEGFQDY